MLKPEQRKFCELYAVSNNGQDAYLKAFKCKPSAARAGASRLLTNGDIVNEIERIRLTVASKPGGVFLTLEKKRDFLRRLVEASVTTTSADSDLWNSVKTTEFGHEFKLPCKLGAIKLDNDLAGQGSEAGANDAIASLLKTVIE